MLNISAHQIGRKPPWPLPPRDWKPRNPPTIAGEHYLRPVVADRVKHATARAHVHGLLQAHLEDVKVGLPHGCAGAVQLGRDTACRVIDAMKADLRARHPRLLAGGAVAFCAALGVRVGVDAASAACRMISAATPILKRAGRFQWVADLAALKACRHGDRMLEAVLSHGLASDEQGVTLDIESTPRESEPDRSPGADTKMHARSVVLAQYPAADSSQGEHEDMGGLGCASASPAGQARACLAVSPASVGDALKASMTQSAWMQAVPAGVHVQRLLRLLADAPVSTDWSGSRREFVDRLAREDGRWTSRRDRFGLLRALGVFERLGLVLGGDTARRLPEFVLHDAVEAVGLESPRPSTQLPTPAMNRALERRCVDPAGLSRGEARAVSYRLHTRAMGEKLSYRQLGAIGQVLGQRPGEMSRALVDSETSAQFEALMRMARRVMQ